jgi:hypothetical protein
VRVCVRVCESVSVCACECTKVGSCSLKEVVRRLTANVSVCKKCTRVYLHPMAIRTHLSTFAYEGVYRGACVCVYICMYMCVYVRAYMSSFQFFNQRIKMM